VGYVRYEHSIPVSRSSFPFPQTGSPQRGAPGSCERSGGDRDHDPERTRTAQRRLRPAGGLRPARGGRGLRASSSTALPWRWWTGPWAWCRTVPCPPTTAHEGSDEAGHLAPARRPAPGLPRAWINAPSSVVRLILRSAAKRAREQCRPDSRSCGVPRTTRRNWKGSTSCGHGSWHGRRGRSIVSVHKKRPASMVGVRPSDEPLTAKMILG
jgi:hypothetical protein